MMGVMLEHGLTGVIEMEVAVKSFKTHDELTVMSKHRVIKQKSCFKQALKIPRTKWATRKQHSLEG